MEWDDEKVLKLIDLYHSKPLLWNPKHSDYKKRPKRFDALNDIATELLTSVNEVERKIKNLTSHYYREKKKENSSNKSGAGTDEIYQSKWLAYKPLNFLSNKNEPIGTMETDTPEGHNSQQGSQNLLDLPIENITPKANKRPRYNQKDEIVSEALTIMRNISGRQNASKEKDEDGLFGDYIASQLRKMDRSTKAIVRHRINNIIFETETGYRADMFSDFSRSPSAHSHPGYYATAATLPTNYSAPTTDTLPTNYSAPTTDTLPTNYSTPTTDTLPANYSTPTTDTLPTNYSTPTTDTLPTNYSTPVYSEYSNQLNANPQTVSPLETLDAEDAAPNLCNRSSQDIENILTSFEK